MLCKLRLILAALVAGLHPVTAQPTPPLLLRVPATANPYLAGMPEGTASTYGDRAPAQSPVLVDTPLVGAVSVSFHADGAANHLPGCPPNCDSPNGSVLTDHQGGVEHGISGIRAPMNALLGVFLDDARPDRTRPPKTLNFSRSDFTSLSPQLKQVFFIGTGRNRRGDIRKFLVPTGATRLFLGVMDGYEWNNNTGSYSVEVTIERTNVSSNLYSVESTISFAKWACLPDRSQCTPARELVEERAPGQFHVLLPAQLEWGAGVPTPPGATVTIRGAMGTVCLDAQSRSTSSCLGPAGSGMPAGAGFLAPDKPAGALIARTLDGKTWFSVNERAGIAFQSHQGYFEFDVAVR